jgi:protein arginine kinase
MENWIKHKTEDNDIVLSSRIRVARNIKNKPFPHKLNECESREIVKSVEEAIFASAHIKKQYNSIYMWELDDGTGKYYLEKHLISPKFLTNKEKAAFILGENETVSIMINEEDHIRLQCITGGLDLNDPYDMANKLDNLLEENIDIAFDEKLGYITACPTNIGTGLRASVMIHLPALTMNDEMNEILKVLTQVGMTIRGLYGEGSKAEGNIYQISNQITLGVNEEDILNNLKTVVTQIVNQEYMTREKFLKSYRYELEDKIYRSLGILETAVLLNINECLDLLSNVRMGVELGIIKNVDKMRLNSLLFEAQPAALQKRLKTNLSDKERDFSRAKLVREELSKNTHHND